MLTCQRRTFLQATERGKIKPAQFLGLKASIQGIPFRYFFELGYVNVSHRGVSWKGAPDLISGGQSTPLCCPQCYILLSFVWAQIFQAKVKNET